MPDLRSRFVAIRAISHVANDIWATSARDAPPCLTRTPHPAQPGHAPVTHRADPPVALGEHFAPERPGIGQTNLQNHVISGTTNPFLPPRRRASNAATCGAFLLYPDDEFESDPGVDVASLLTQDARDTVEIFFDEAHYFDTNTDVQDAGIEGFGHFLTNGFAEGRAPSRLVEMGFLKFLVSQEEHPLEEIPETIDAFAEMLEDWPSDTVFGPAPLLCPQWLKMQLGLTEELSLAELLATEAPVGQISLHPGFSAITVTEAQPLHSLFKGLSDADYEELSLIDLTHYISNHRDLAHLRGKTKAAFAHLWSNGAFENRLKYLGNRRPSNAAMEMVYLTQCATVYRTHMSRSSLLSPQNPTSLLPQTLKFGAADDPSILAVRKVMTRAHPNEDTDLSLEGFLLLQEVMAKRETLVIPALVDEDAPAPTLRPVGAEAILDRDLLSGAHKVTTKRVVYCVNLGGYDDLPIPPEMEDCSYFLITDAAEIPEGSPWTVVSPTLQETDIKRQCLWYKTHPHWLFPDAEFVTWIDSNVECKSSSGQILIAHETLSEIATFLHPDRDCVYEEALMIKKLKLDQAPIIERVLEQMKKDGLPKHYGLYETNVLFSRNQDLGVRAFFETWWRRIYLGSRRDQMSFTYSAWKEGIDITPLDARYCAKNSRFFTKRAHKNLTGRFV